MKTDSAGEYNVGAFARVMTWDPDQQELMPERAGEFPAGFVFPGQELMREAEGYRAPAWTAKGCVIGLDWEENRFFHTLAIEVANKADVEVSDAIRVEYWLDYAEGDREKPGSRWQGAWAHLDVEPEKQSKRLVYRLGADHHCVRMGAMKVRWVFTGRATPVVVARLCAFTLSRWERASLRLEADQNVKGSARISIYNGWLSTPTVAWDAGQAQLLDVIYSEAPADRQDVRYSDRTLITLALPKTTVSVAVEDVLGRGPVYIPCAGVYVARADDARQLEDYRKEVDGRRTIRERVREESDQSLQKVMAQRNPCADSSPTFLSLACHNRKFILLRGGALITTGFRADAKYVDSEFFCMSPTFGMERYQEGNAACWTAEWGQANPGRIHRRLQEGWLPIVENRFVEGAVEYRQCTFVAPLAQDVPQSQAWCGDRPSVGVAAYVVANTGREQAAVRLALAFESRSQKHPPGLDDPRISGIVSGSKETFVVGGEKVDALVNTAERGDLEVGHQDGVVVVSGMLGAGESATIIVYVHEKTTRATNFSGARELRCATARYWQDALTSGTVIETPEALLNNIVRGSLVRFLIDARNEEDGERVAPWIAAFAYGALENEGQTIVRCMTHWGFTGFACRSLDYFLHLYNDEGLLSTGYTTMGTPWHLWAMAEHYDATGDRGWLASVAPAMRKACDWIVRQRQKTMGHDADGERLPEYGLIPPGLTGDWSRFGYRFYSQAIYYAGLSNAARVLKAIGDEGADDLVEASRRFRADIVRSYRIAQSRHPVLPLPDGRWVRSYPCMIYGRGRAGLLFPSGNRGNTYGYDLDHGAMHLVALGVIDPRAEEVDEMLDEIEDAAFLGDCYHNAAYSAARNHELWFDCGGFSKYYVGHNRIGDIYAQRDEVKPMIRSVFNCIPAALDVENLTFWEHGIGAAWDKTHHAARILLWIRSMFVYERGDELWLAGYVPSHYLTDGQTVRVERAASAFGEVSYRVVSRIAEGMIEAEIDPPTRRLPTAIVLRVRHPEEKAMVSVRVNGVLYDDFDAVGGIVRLPADVGRMRVEVAY